MKTVYGLMVLALGFLAGCESVRPDLTRTGAVSVQNLPDHETRIFAVSARQNGPELVVSGTVRRAFSDNSPLMQGHVDVAAYDASGKLITAAVADQSPDILPTGSSRSAVFTANLQVQVASGMVLKVQHHVGMPGTDGCVAQ